MGCDLIQVAGLVPFTTIDYPGCLSAVIFCQGCPWACGYCHNPHLQPISLKGSLSWDKTLSLLGERRGFLDAVVFSGGEPLLQRNLGEGMQQIKDLGMKVGIHTAGIYPRKLKEILKYLDWVGMDIKAPFHSYEKITRVRQSGKGPKESAALILQSGVDYEFRTTVHPDLLSSEDLYGVAQELKEMKADTFVLQKFRSNGCGDADLNKTGSFSMDFQLIQYLQESFVNFMIRE